MRVLINDFELNSAANRVYLDPDIQGLDMPTIRTSKGVRAGSHGGYIGKQLFGPRSIVFQGRIFSDTPQEAIEKRRMIQASLPLFPQVIELRIIDDDGSTYLIYCNVIDFQMPIGRFRRKSLFKLDLEATDPVIYDDSAGGLLSTVIKKEVAGGLLMSPTSPAFGYSMYFSGSQPNVVVTNPTDLVSLPVAVLVGKTSDPVITNKRTGDTFGLSGYSVDENAVTQIDMKNRSVRLGTVDQLDDDPTSPTYGQLPDGVGSNMFGYIAPGSTWIGLAPGDNEMVLSSDHPSDARQVTLYWRPGMVGI